MHKHKDSGVEIDLSAEQAPVVAAFESNGFQEVSEEIKFTKTKIKKTKKFFGKK